MCGGCVLFVHWLLACWMDTVCVLERNALLCDKFRQSDDPTPDTSVENSIWMTFSHERLCYSCNYRATASNNVENSQCCKTENVALSGIPTLGPSLFWEIILLIGTGFLMSMDNYPQCLAQQWAANNIMTIHVYGLKTLLALPFFLLWLLFSYFSIFQDNCAWQSPLTELKRLQKYYLEKGFKKERDNWNNKN